MSRLTPGMMTVVLFALLAGLGGAYVVQHHIQQPGPLFTPQVAAREEGYVVPFALTDMEKGRVVTLNDIGVKRLNAAEYKKSTYAKQTFLNSTSQIQGRTLKVTLKKGETFTPDNLYPFGDGPGVEDRLEAGYRAVSIPVKNVGAVEGFARPGSYVDVLFRSSAEGRRPEVTLTLFERIQVLAINTNVVEGQRVAVKGDGTVTLSVTPHQAKVLKVVEGRGELSLMLRNPDDDFQFLPFDPALERSLSQLGLSEADLTAVSYPARAATSANARANTAAEAGAADAVEGVDRVIGNASERVTIDDLLGLPAEPEKQEMEIYFGSRKEVMTFEVSDGETLEVLRRGGRIRTPIVEYPMPPKPRRTAQTDSPYRSVP